MILSGKEKLCKKKFSIIKASLLCDVGMTWYDL